MTQRDTGHWRRACEEAVREELVRFHYDAVGAMAAARRMADWSREFPADIAAQGIGDAIDVFERLALHARHELERYESQIPLSNSASQASLDSIDPGR